VASYKEQSNSHSSGGIPSLDELEPGKPCGAVLPMSERARTQLRDSMEVIEYLLNRERVVWTWNLPCYKTLVFELQVLLSLLIHSLSA
jgi:hypothetical protein